MISRLLFKGIKIGGQNSIPLGALLEHTRSPSLMHALGYILKTTLFDRISRSKVNLFKWNENKIENLIFGGGFIELNKD